MQRQTDQSLVESTSSLTLQSPLPLFRHNGVDSKGPQPMQFISDTGPYSAPFTREAFEMLVMKGGPDSDANQLCQQLVQYLTLTDRCKQMAVERRNMKNNMTSLEHVLSQYLLANGGTFPLIDGHLKVVEPAKKAPNMTLSGRPRLTTTLRIKDMIRYMCRYFVDVKETSNQDAMNLTREIVNFMLNENYKEVETARRPPRSKKPPPPPPPPKLVRVWELKKFDASKVQPNSGLHPSLDHAIQCLTQDGELD